MPFFQSLIECVCALNTNYNLKFILRNGFHYTPYQFSIETISVTFNYFVIVYGHDHCSAVHVISLSINRLAQLPGHQQKKSPGPNQFEEKI